MEAAALPPKSARSPAVAPLPGGSDVASDLRLEVLVYAAVASERMAFINGRKYVEGQRLAGGLVVEKITEEGVILGGQGRQFLLRPPR